MEMINKIKAESEKISKIDKLLGKTDEEKVQMNNIKNENENVTTNMAEILKILNESLLIYLKHEIWTVF